MHLQAIDLALAREEQHVLVHGRNKHLVDDVVLFKVDARHALAATLLGAIGGHRDALDVAGVGDGHDHVLVGNQIFDVQVLLDMADLGAALVAELLGNLAHLFLDDAQDFLLVR